MSESGGPQCTVCESPAEIGVYDENFCSPSCFEARLEELAEAEKA